MTIQKTTLWLILLLVLHAKSAEAQPTHISATVGQHQVVFPAGYRGLNYFPDEPISVINERPFRFLLVAWGKTYLMQGRTLETAVPLKTVLDTGGKTAFDNGYTGVSSVYIDKQRKTIFAFYHAEDHVGMPRVARNNLVPGAYWSIGLAVSRDGGSTFAKTGQILRASVSKAQVSKEIQGLGDVCVTPDASSTYLYAYFTDLTRKEVSPAAKIGMARCLIKDRARPGTWHKYHNGRFTEKGLGGMESPVLTLTDFPGDVFNPHVTYIPEMKRYVMVCNVLSFADLERPRPTKGGIYFCHSEDGIKWTQPKPLVIGHSMRYCQLLCSESVT